MVSSANIVVIGASTGGIDALKTLVAGLPSGFPAPLAIVQHTSAQSPNTLACILEREGLLDAVVAKNGDTLVAGRIYVAPADRHLLVDGTGRLLTTRGPKENRVRPAIDPLFRSAAMAFGPHVVGVVLTGLLDDGTAGLWAIRQQGGIAIIQNPEEAVAPSMPLTALKNVEVNHCVRIAELAPLLVKLTSQPASPASSSSPAVPSAMDAETRIAAAKDPMSSGIVSWGKPSLFSCPECHGVLLEVLEGSNLRFRCHTGHAYSLETLLDDYREKTETMLWNAMRACNELVLLLRRMAERLERLGRSEEAGELRRNADENVRLSERVQRLISDPGSGAGDSPPPPRAAPGQA
ncbi:chemotaxis protein CheB [Opitutaceae bacterium EW11]|nr:chemotaxis protein CheB [Opitutaceae bacterium EW11]